VLGVVLKREVSLENRGWNQRLKTKKKRMSSYNLRQLTNNNKYIKQRKRKRFKGVKEA